MQNNLSSGRLILDTILHTRNWKNLVPKSLVAVINSRSFKEELEADADYQKYLESFAKDSGNLRPEGVSDLPSFFHKHHLPFLENHFYKKYLKMERPLHFISINIFLESLFKNRLKDWSAVFSLMQEKDLGVDPTVIRDKQGPRGLWRFQHNFVIRDYDILQTDASVLRPVHGLMGKAGFSAVLRKPNGKIYDFSCGGIPYTEKPEGMTESQYIMKYELIAMKAGLELAKARKWTKIHLQSDSADLVNIIEGKVEIPEILFHDFMDLMAMLRDLESYHVSHIPHELNQFADYLATDCVKKQIVRRGMIAGLVAIASFDMDAYPILRLPRRFGRANVAEEA